MIVVTESIVINQPIETVFNFVSQLDKGPQWQSGLIKVEHIGTGAGAKVIGTNQYLGQKFQTESEITQFVPPRLITYRSYAGPLKFDVRYHLEEIDANSTKFTSRNEVELGSFFKLAEPAIEEVTHSKIVADIAALKGVLESPDFSPSSPATTSK